jgi:hypothetical protein
MSIRVAGWLAWPLCMLLMILIASAVMLAALNGYSLWNVSFLFPVASAALVGGLIASRRTQNPIGWFILGHALCFTLGEFGRQYAIYGILTEPASLPAARLMAATSYWIWSPGIILGFCLLPLYFPNGRLPSQRWRPVVWLALFAAVITSTLGAILPGANETRGIPNPLGIEALRPFVDTLGAAQLVWLGLLVAAAASLVVRFRHSGGEQRQQVKWVVYAVVFLAAYLIADVFLEEFLRGSLPTVVEQILGVVALSGLWVAIAVAVLRYRLYNIDLLINRTLVYGVLTALLAALYFGGVATIQSLFRALTGQEQQPQLAIVVSTLAIAALFNPLRRRVQAFVDRRFYRKKYDAAKTLEAFGARLRDETDLEHLCGDLVSVVRETMQPKYASLWLRSPAEIRRGGEESSE